MRLLQIDSNDRIRLTNDLLHNIPPYAILSHTWGADHDECTFEDLRDGTGTSKPGYAKILFCGQQARKDELEYFWVDSVCINKSNHAELSEAINSMFRWYQGADMCYVYLTDVSVKEPDRHTEIEDSLTPALRKSRWFTRGWTLQELLAPNCVEFFSREGAYLGSKRSLRETIQEITGVPVAALEKAPLNRFSVDERMHWASNRDTTRLEDKVYCLLGIFGVFMSPIYGEGEHAWTRLMDAISISYRRELDEIHHNLETAKFRKAKLPQIDHRMAMLMSLKFEQMDSRRSVIKGAYATTCEWLLRHPVYITWNDPARFWQHHGLLWIKGKPGAGKSTLVKFAYMQAEAASDGDEIVVSFFFNARGHELERSAAGMYRSLLFQILDKAPDLHRLLDMFQPQDRKRFQAQNKEIRQAPMWTVEALTKLLSRVATSFKDLRLKCFIDALDECEEQQAREMVHFFEELGHAALASKCNVSICFASRHYPAIEIGHGCQMTLEDESGHGEDLAKYVQNHLRAGKGKYIEEVKTQVIKKANGVFMWAVVVIEILNQEFLRGRIFAVKKRLQEIPPMLGDLFSDILKRDSTHVRDLLLCLQWILFASRPLKREEFYFAMVAGLDVDPDDMTEWEPEQVTNEDMTRFILNSSKGLAEFTKGDPPTVQFIHESVRDFLLKDGGLSKLSPRMSSSVHSLSHEVLKTCCQNYLDANRFRNLMDQPGRVKASSDLRQCLGSKLPFLDYASRNLLYHADEAARDIPQDSFLENLALQSLISVTNVFDRDDNTRYEKDAALVYVLAEGNYVRLIRTARHKGFAWNVRGGQYQFPLFAALAGGHQAAVHALLFPEDEISEEDPSRHLELGTELALLSIPESPTPLFWALEKGYAWVAEILAGSAEIDPNLRGDDGRTALSIAAELGYDSTVRKLLDCHPAIDASLVDDVYRSPLSYAAQKGRVNIVEMLIAISPSNMLVDGDISGRTPLSYAAQSGSTVTTRLLLTENTANKVDRLNRTPLTYAAEEGHTAVVQLLLDELFVSVAIADLYDRSALSFAVVQHQTSVIKALLRDRRAQSGTTDVFNRSTALLTAIQMGDHEVLRVLLKYGADAEARTGHRARTPLSFAAEYGDIESIKILLGHHADVDARDDDGYTALYWAILQGQESAAELLLTSGASLDPAITIDGSSMLSYLALRTGFNEDLGTSPDYETDFRMAKLLIEHGLDIEAKDSSGGTALLAAAAGGNVGFVRMLLERGANTGVTDLDGYDAFSLATENGSKEVIRLLHQSAASDASSASLVKRLQSSRLTV